MTAFYIARVEGGVPVLGVNSRGVPGEAGDIALIQGRLDALYGVYRPQIVSYRGVVDEPGTFPRKVYDQGYAEGNGQPIPGGSTELLPFDVRMALQRLNDREGNPRQQPPIICSDGTRVSSVLQCPETFATRRGLPAMQLGYAAASSPMTAPLSVPALQQARSNPDCPRREDFLPYCDPCTQPLCGDVIIEDCPPIECPPERQRNSAGLRFLIGDVEARPSMQIDIDVTADARPPSTASDCVYFGDACCKLTSAGLWRCSWPDQPGRPGSGGACTPGVETCPPWLVNEIRQSALAATVPEGRLFARRLLPRRRLRAVINRERVRGGI